MALNKRIIAIASGGIMAIACLFYIISNALPSWSIKEYNLADIALSNNGVESKLVESTIGLWRLCTTAFGPRKCEDQISSCSLFEGEVASACHKMLAARVFITLACIFSAISAICLVACAIEAINKNPMIVMVVKILPIICFVMGIIGLALGISYTTFTGSISMKVSLGAGAILVIIAVIINLIGAILALVIR
ncbi:hypothetical protein I4U23_005983 [Adineta vaga]|nr:hypothetical protein I4U23_005983 [Adineta vaga]